MDGSRRELIGLGHDLQAVSELEATVALREPGVFFTPAELRHFAAAATPLESMAGGFAAKEALFKALPTASGTWFWTDAELVHDRRGAPGFAAHGALAEHLARRRLRVRVSISHSGGFVSSVVVVTGARALTGFSGTIHGAVRGVLQRITARASGASQRPGRTRAREQRGRA
ncbi:4'-phosphopantetheinyl transferase superfamily protein [Streptomyces sp. TRM 70351]|uniref:holo-ACP synthase n=1 Tax=Streptomyces sp. TRM 70351 TaxID=3116552 RepID=UPI002E7B97E8|nr:4'-phosphopantetheinyl transferase superfamily protein [Streptomyces sp. TRM 70351]MEE1930314.1 4'-phosphopantetheinyl transferase superfamily protein [Streptomyces sp. TRM 70351]